MDHISSPNPIKTVNTKSLKHYLNFIFITLLNYLQHQMFVYLSVLIPREFSTGIMRNYMQAKTSFNVYNFMS